MISRQLNGNAPNRDMHPADQIVRILLDTNSEGGTNSPVDGEETKNNI